MNKLNNDLNTKNNEIISKKIIEKANTPNDLNTRNNEIISKKIIEKANTPNGLNTRNNEIISKKIIEKANTPNDLNAKNNQVTSKYLIEKANKDMENMRQERNEYKNVNFSYCSERYKTEKLKEICELKMIFSEENKK
jgi:hypothetical protein